MLRINKKIILSILLLCLSAHLPAQSNYLSVKQYGAKGDGASDDTEAIEKAIQASQQAGISVNKIPGVYGENGGVIYVGASKIVFFPSGMYKISRPIQVGSYTHLLGERAILIPSGALKQQGAAIQSSSWDGHFEGLQFVGFKTAIKIDNKNLDCGKIQIENCDFINNKMAIELFALSSISIIKENRFFKNDKVINIIGGDKVIMSENWITSGHLQGKQDAQIINHGVLHFNHNLLVPSPPVVGAIEPAWINNYTNVSIEGTRQGGEDGSFTLVNNFANANIAYPAYPNGVVIKNSDCYAVYGNTATYFQPAAVRLIGIPNTIVLEDLRGFIYARVIDISQASYKEASQQLSRSSGAFSVRINNIQGPQLMKNSNGTNLPDALQKFEIR